MGWANCGTDDLGRPIGYAHPATCDHPECDKQIDRGLFFVCGNMHGGDEHGCGRYFCWTHLEYEQPRGDPRLVQLCAACAKALHKAEGGGDQ